jgi:Uri superfamily endonuclease
MVWAAHPTAWNQQWKYADNGYLQNSKGMVAYVGRDADKGNVQMLRKNNKDARQQWTIEYVDKSKF